MQELVYGLAIKWFVSELATAAPGASASDIKTKVEAKADAFATSLHVAFLTPEMNAGIDAVLNGVTAALQDKADLQALLAGIAAKDPLAAEAALKAMLLKVTSGDLAKIVAAA
jgi:hypothetical protein